MTSITRRAALGGIAAISATGGAGAALATSTCTMSPEDIHRRIDELACEISELLPHHPIQGAGRRGWHVGVNERGYWFSAVPAPEPQDPLVDAVEAYWEDRTRFETCKLDDNDEIDAYASITYAPRLDVLDAWDRPAMSREGAIAALQFAVDEDKDFRQSTGVNAMIKAALGYLERKKVA